MPAPPKSWSSPEPPVSTSLPAPPNSWAAGSAPLALVERDRVVAALAEHLDQRGVGDRRRAARDGYGAAVDENLSGRVAADRDGVVDVVAEHRQQAGAREKLALIAMVVVLSKVWPRRRCALAVNRVEWGALARSRMLSGRSDEGWSWQRPPGLCVSRENGGVALQKYFSYR